MIADLSANIEQRPRRLRATAAIRDAVAETDVLPRHLVAPFFVTSGPEGPVAGMPGVERLTPEGLMRQLERSLAAGVRTVMLFGVVPDPVKDHTGTAATDGRGPVVRALRLARKAFGDELVLMTDACLCGYTDHGHCGLPDPDGRIDNDATLPLLAQMALSHAAAGADIIAPSDMMDGRVGEIRRALDGEGFAEVPILSYAVKYASSFYGPFRDAAESTPAFGDRRGYQMDPANAREALREARLDESEGADMLMVKPALPYLDVIQRVRQQTDLPVWAYHVSGEYSMVMAAGERGWLDADRAMEEVLTSIRRAGADGVGKGQSFGLVDMALIVPPDHNAASAAVCHD